MILKLVKTYYKGNGGLAITAAITSKKTDKKGNVKLGSKIITYIGLAYIALIYMATVYSSFYNYLLLSPSLALIIVNALAILFSIFFTLTSADNVLVSGKDLDILRALPISSKTLTHSRFVALYIEIFIETLIVYIPFAICSALNCSFNLYYYLLIFLSIFITPAFGAFFMGIFTYLSYLSRVIKHLKNAIVWILTIGLLYFLLKNFGSFMGLSAQSIILPERVIITGSLVFQFFLLVISITALSIIFYFICLYLSLKVQNSEELKEKQRKIGKNGVSYKRNSITLALLKREVRLIFQNQAIATELCLEAVMPLFILVIYAVMGILNSLVADVMSIPGISSVMHLIIAAVILLFYSFTLFSSTSISREGQEFEISKTYPIDAKTRVNSKILFHLLTLGTISLLFLLIVLIYFKAPIVDSILLIMLFIIFNSAISVIGLTIDYKNPHTEWQRPQEAVKQNTNGLIGMGFGLLLLCIIGGVFALSLIFIKIKILSFILSLVIALITFIIFYKSAIKSARAQYYS